MSSIAGLVLAAGAGRRFGGPKALVRFGDETLVERAVGVLIAGGCRSPVDVVLGMRPDGSLPATDEIRVSWNLSWRDGISSSLRHGLMLLEPDHDVSAVVVLLVDQPGIRPEAVGRLIDAHRHGAVLAVATYGGRRGHPVLLDRASWARVQALATADDGARAFMRTHPESVTEVPCDGLGVPDDIDTPEDLERLQRKLGNRRDAGTPARASRRPRPSSC